MEKLFESLQWGYSNVEGSLAQLGVDKKMQLHWNWNWS